MGNINLRSREALLSNAYMYDEASKAIILWIAVGPLRHRVASTLARALFPFLTMKFTISYMKTINKEVNFASCPLFANLKSKTGTYSLLAAREFINDNIFRNSRDKNSNFPSH